MLPCTILIHITVYLLILQKFYDVAKRNCNEALQLAKKTKNGEAYEQSQNCLKVISETVAAEKK